jgi:hypothetical protein
VASIGGADASGERGLRAWEVRSGIEVRETSKDDDDDDPGGTSKEL